MKLLGNTRINEYTITLVKANQQFYELIYSLNLMELETLKTYIKTNQKSGFICLFKSTTSTLIFFEKKGDRSFYLYVIDQGLNN